MKLVSLNNSASSLNEPGIPAALSDDRRLEATVPPPARPGSSIVWHALLASLLCATLFASASLSQTSKAPKMKLRSVPAPQTIPFPVYNQNLVGKSRYFEGQAGPRAVLELSQSTKDGPNAVLKWYSDSLAQNQWKVSFQPLPPPPSNCDLKKLYFLSARKENKDLMMTIISQAEPKKPADTLITIMMKQ